MPTPPSVERAVHEHWCNWIGHQECCGKTEADCDCGAYPVNAYITSLEVKIIALKNELAELEQSEARG